MKKQIINAWHRYDEFPNGGGKKRFIDIEGDEILRIGSMNERQTNSPEIEITDAAGMIVMPGFR